MSLITKPTKEPILSVEAKGQLNIEHDDDDLLIERFIVAARQHIEAITGLSIIRQQRRLYLDSFCEASLPFGPVKSIEQVQYVDGDGNTQVLATSVYELDPEYSKILLSYDQSWPSTRAQKNAVNIDYWCGYFDNSVSPINITDDLPEDLKHCMFMLIADMYLNRESQLDLKTYKNMAFDLMIAPYRTYLQ